MFINLVTKNLKHWKLGRCSPDRRRAMVNPLKRKNESREVVYDGGNNLPLSLRACSPSENAMHAHSMFVRCCQSSLQATWDGRNFLPNHKSQKKPAPIYSANLYFKVLLINGQKLMGRYLRSHSLSLKHFFCLTSKLFPSVL